MKRYRTRKAKPGQLLAYYGRPSSGDDPDIVYAYGGAGATRRDGGLLSYFLQGMKWPDKRNLVEELEARGYDITTLRFSIERKPVNQ